MPFPSLLPRAGALTLVLVLLAAGPTAARTPKAVRDARASVVSVETKTQKGAGFSISETGLFLTASANVARTQDIELVYRGKRVAAKRVESSAPRGITMLQASTQINVPPLSVKTPADASNVPIWVLGVNRSRRVNTRRARLVKVNSTGSLSTTGVTNESGQNGGPLLSSTGAVIGVSAPPRPGDGTTALVSYALPESPGETSGTAVADDGDFPAVPVAIALGLLLLIASGTQQLRRNRSAGSSSLPAIPTPAVATAVASPSPAAGDEIEVTLRPRT